MGREDGVEEDIMAGRSHTPKVVISGNRDDSSALHMPLGELEAR